MSKQPASRVILTSLIPLVLVASIAAPGFGQQATATAKSDTEPKAEAVASADSSGVVEKAVAKKKEATVASLAVGGMLPESPSQAGLFGEVQANLSQLMSRLEKVAEDDDVSAVILRIRSPSIGRGKLNELRAAIMRARQAGKTIYADLEMATAADYLLACACDKIIMPESGMLLVPGVRAEIMFYKGLFDKLGIQADMLQMGKFKGAAEPYSRTGMSPAFREQYDLLVDDLFDHMVDTIATDRRMNRQQVAKLIDQGLFTAQAAKEQGLIDAVAYDDQSRSMLKSELSADELKVTKDYGKKKVDTDFSGMMGMVKLMELFTGGSASSRGSKKNKIAVIYAVGVIMSGKSQTSLLSGEVMGSDTIVEAIREAEEAENVKAIVLRVDSPGGSALASDLIWRAIREAKKPVIASMGDTAASGGYYISMGCDRIFAEPGTLTGSIGVVGGKLATGKAFDKVGLNIEVISRGENSGIFTANQPFSESERKAMLAMMEDVYEQFTSKAAAGRKMGIDRLKSSGRRPGLDGATGKGTRPC